MKSIQAVGFLSLAVVLVCFSLFASVASAGFTSVYVSGATNGVNPDYTWSIENDGWLGVDEVWDSTTGPGYGFNVWGTTDSDPILTITKDILNGSSFPWNGYSITLDPFDTDKFVGVPSSGGTSGGMTLGFQDDYNLIWTTPNIVQPGETVSFTFQINVPDTGDFNFTLSQSPDVIPEPASITLVGLALVMFAAVRRKFA